MNFYDLVPLLWEEADNIPLEIELLCREMGSRRERLEYLELQTLLFSHWDDYNKMIDSSADLLQNCAELYLEYNQVRCDADLEDPREEELEEGPVEENEEEIPEAAVVNEKDTRWDKLSKCYVDKVRFHLSPCLCGHLFVLYGLFDCINVRFGDIP